MEAKDRYSKKRLSINPIVLMTCFTIFLNILVYILFGHKALFAYLSISFVAIFSVEVTEYIQHYGLLRKEISENRYEKMTAKFAWHSYSTLTNYVMMNLQRHGDHHENPNLAYQELKYKSGVPIMPYSQSLMYLLAMVPPLWFKIMNPLVEELRENNYYRDS
jgi:alkane 1-monooxygenase